MLRDWLDKDFMNMEENVVQKKHMQMPRGDRGHSYFKEQAMKGDLLEGHEDRSQDHRAS